VAAGAFLRFATLGVQSFWLDEAFTYRIVAQGFGHVLSTVPKTESTPPLYYVLVWLWSRVFGVHEDGLRSFSAVCGTLTIPVVWALGRQIASERIGFVAASLTAVDPLLLWYSQEARSYALLVLLSATTLVALLWALARPSRFRLAGWGISAALALCTHYFALFVVIPEAAWLLIGLRRRSVLTWRNLAVGLGPVVVMGIALAPLALHQIPNGRSIENSQSLSLGLRLVAQQDFVGYGEPTTALTALYVVFVAVIALAVSRPAEGRERLALGLAIALAAVAIAAPVLVALGGSDYVDSRNMLATWPLIALAIAVVLGAARAGWTGMLGLGALVALSLFCWISLQGEPNLQRADWRGTVRAIGFATVPRAIVSYVDAGLSLTPYMSALVSYPAVGARIQEIDVLSPFGAWLGATPYPLRAAPSPAGFEVADRVKTKTYLVVRYRARRPRVEEPAELAALYPGLHPVGVFVQRP
jgi:4-amino-4-deoxy-L-arabinose transferase-like glycosyltransferase